MKNLTKLFSLLMFMITFSSCTMNDGRPKNETALDEQAATELNQKTLLTNQPPPKLDWSLERDNLIKRFKLMNDRSVMFYMYVFIEGCSQPIGYYQVNKVSSVNSQLTNTMQIISGMHSDNDIPAGQIAVIPSPAEDGSYGTNGDGVFGFTPEDIYIEHNMKYIVSTVPLTFEKPVQLLAILDDKTSKSLHDMMQRINSDTATNVHVK